MGSGFRGWGFKGLGLFGVPLNGGYKGSSKGLYKGTIRAL